MAKYHAGFSKKFQVMENINKHLRPLMASTPLQLLWGLPHACCAPPCYLSHLHISEKYD